MIERKKSLYPVSLLILSFTFLCLNIARGSVIELEGLEVDLGGRVFLYEREVPLREVEPVQDDIFISRLASPFHDHVFLPGFPTPWVGGSFSSRQDANPERLKVLGRALDEGGMAAYPAAYGDYCYVATTGNLGVFDVSNLNAPVQINEIDEPAGELVRKGTLMGGIMGIKGDFVLFDLTDPASPSEVSRISPPEDFHFRGLSLGDSLAVAIGNGYLDTFGHCSIMQVIDISDSSAPKVESTMLGLFDFFRTVLIEQNMIFLTVQSEGLSVFDVTDPKTIIQTGYVNCYIYVDGLAYDGGYLFCAGQGLEVVDVSDPYNPELVAQVGGAHVSDLELSGGLAYVADDDDHTFRVYDVTDPLNPQKFSELQAYGRAYSLDLEADKIYFGDTVYGLGVVDISTPATPQLISMTPTGVFSRDVDVEGDLAVVTGNFALMHIVGVSDPFAPEVLGVHEWIPDSTPGNTPWQYGVDLEGDLVATNEWYQGIHLYDVSNTTQPDYMGFMKLKGVDNCLDPIALVGGLLYTGMDQLIIMDISDPENPLQVGTGPSVMEKITDIVISGTTGYMTGYTEVVIMDLANPAAPLELHRIQMEEDYIKGVAVENNMLGVYRESYPVHEYTGILDVYDVSNPAVPIPTGSVQIPPADVFTRPDCTVAVDKGRFFIAHDPYMSVIDATDPCNPHVTARYPGYDCNIPTWLSFEGVHAVDGLVYLTGYRGMEILRYLDVGIFLTPETEPVKVPQGGSFTYELKLENFTEETQTIRAWADEVFPGPSGGPSSSPMWITLNPGESVTYSRRLNVPDTTPLGTYHLNAHVVNDAGMEMDNDRISFEVEAGD